MALSKRHTPEPVPALKVPPELWLAVLEGAKLVPIEKTRPHPRNALNVPGEHESVNTTHGNQRLYVAALKRNGRWVGNLPKR